MDNMSFALYLLVAAGITYLIRMIPLVLIKRKIKNTFVLSFLYYLPYTVLSVMTIPAIFYSTSNAVSAVFGFLTALVLAYKEKSLVKVAAISCAVVFAVEFVIDFL